ncbi:hypothetical protein VP01_592g2 [Puccinia sorghi]|uniref:Uncharacterized protein n=1 Tax=Puccinia sorghi TaxID=27349 RepID=A0A0L6UHP7_9BASI|nr:hypothetical protein VP01_592g2 [Puccinia sorghi]
MALLWKCQESSPGDKCLNILFFSMNVKRIRDEKSMIFLNVLNYIVFLCREATFLKYKCVSLLTRINLLYQFLEAWHPGVGNDTSCQGQDKPKQTFPCRFVWPCTKNTKKSSICWILKHQTHPVGLFCTLRVILRLCGQKNVLSLHWKSNKAGTRQGLISLREFLEPIYYILLLENELPEFLSGLLTDWLNLDGCQDPWYGWALNQAPLELCQVGLGHVPRQTRGTISNSLWYFPLIIDSAWQNSPIKLSPLVNKLKLLTPSLSLFSLQITSSKPLISLIFCPPFCFLQFFFCLSLSLYIKSSLSRFNKSSRVSMLSFHYISSLFLFFYRLHENHISVSKIREAMIVCCLDRNTGLT